MGVPPTAVLFLTHFVNSGVVRRYRRLQRELAGRHPVYFGIDLVSSPAHRRVTGDLVGPLLFPFDRALLGRLPYRRAREDWQGGNSVVPGRVDLVAQFFRRLHPQFERIYVVEYDVVYGGHWGSLFADLDARPADLLGTNSFRRDEQPEWNLWPTLRTPDVALPFERTARALLSFCRYSRAALLALEGVYARGWEGHFEALAPTAVLEAGLVFEDIGGEGPFVPPGRERLHYWSDRMPPPPFDSVGTFIYRPERRPRGAKVWLWHPVKLPTGLDLLHRLRRRRHGHLDRARFLAADPRYRSLAERMEP